jgi:hypothetical protein
MIYLSWAVDQEIMSHAEAKRGAKRSQSSHPRDCESECSQSLLEGSARIAHASHPRVAKPPRRHLEFLSTSGLLDLAGSYHLAYNPSMHEMVAHNLEGESFIFLPCF